MDSDAHDPVDERAAELAERCTRLEQRVDALASLVANLMVELAGVAHESQLSAADAELAGVAGEPVAEATRWPDEISADFAEVIQLIQKGDSATAQGMLQSMPEEKLTRQPAAVALVAAALCVDRGDFESALQALRRARQLTDEERLLRVIELIEAHAH